jgi:hypothetical protein
MQINDLEAQITDHETHISSDLPFREWLYAWLLNPNIEGNYQKNHRQVDCHLDCGQFVRTDLRARSCHQCTLFNLVSLL